jgi:hypothetical protein
LPYLLGGKPLAIARPAYWLGARLGRLQAVRSLAYVGVELEQEPHQGVGDMSGSFIGEGALLHLFSAVCDANITRPFSLTRAAFFIRRISCICPTLRH